MSGLYFSSTLPQFSQAGHPARFGSDDENEKAIHQKNIDVPQDDDFFISSDKETKGSKDTLKDAREDAFSVNSGSDSDDIESAKSASRVSGLDEPYFTEDTENPRETEPPKDKKFWLKSIALSAISLVSLGAMVLAMLPGIGIGMIPAMGMILGGLLVHDVSTNISRQNGLMNISDLDYIRNALLERSRKPVEIASRIFHPLSPEKQALFVQKHLHRVQNIDPHKLLNKTGLDYQTMLNDLKSETAVAAKALIVGRFMALFLLKRGLGSFVLGKGKIAAWAAMGLWALISQNKHGDLQANAPTAANRSNKFQTASHVPA